MIRPSIPRHSCPTSSPSAASAPLPCSTLHQRLLRKPGAVSSDTATFCNPKQVSDLQDPAKIGAKGTKRQVVQDTGGETCLANYMTLPVEQYFVLDPSMIQAIGKSKFRLQVPPINVFDVSIRAVAEIAVTQLPSAVVLETTNCQLFGNSLIESLNDKFCMRFDTKLTWTSDVSQPGSAMQNSLSSIQSDARQNGATAPAALLNADADLNVWCEVVPPFNLLPRGVLEGTCNVVMRTLLDSLLPVFLRQLANDYEKWAADAAYREERASRSMPLS